MNMLFRPNPFLSACLRKPIVFACLLSAALGLWAQQRPPGTWKSYSSFYYPIGAYQAGDSLYCLTLGGIFRIDLRSGKTETFTPVDGMSGLNLTTFYYDENSGYFFIGYLDGTIDYFQDPEHISTITDINRSQAFTQKRIWKFREHDSLLYVGTEFGVVVYDLYKKETKSSYTKIGVNSTGTPVYSLEIWNDSLFVAMGSFGLWAAPLSSPNLADPVVWSEVTGTNGLPDGNCMYVAQAADVLFATVDDSVLKKPVAQPWQQSLFLSRGRSYFEGQNGVMMTANASLGEAYFVAQDSIVLFDNEGVQTCGMTKNGVIWLGDAGAGLLRYQAGNYVKVSPSGPYTNNSNRVLAGKGELYIAPAGRLGSTPSFENSGFYYYSETSGWKNFNKFQGKLDSTLYRGFVVGYYDPRTEKAYLGSMLQGIMVMYHGDTLHSFTGYNSTLAGFDTTDIRISAIAADDTGAVWATTILTSGDRTLNYLPPNGQGVSYQLTGTRPINLEIDEYGNKWLVNESGGVTVFSEEGTPALYSDDKVRTITNAVGNGALPTMEALCAVRDKNGQIWVGTADGISVFYDPWSVYSNSFPDGSCPVYQNQCLLKFQKAKDICVDGANRKWIASEDGAFLMSEDGTELIHHFTMENSPLASNNINDISIDPSSGEVFFATDRGVVSFMGDAINAYADASSLYAFPNPVMPDYEGDIIIRGVAQDTKVKITAASGRMVREIQALGGQAVWDGKDMWGNRVHSGVYLVMVADTEGNNSGITKVAILSR